MHRFYIPEKIVGGRITIADAEQLHHLRDVLRLKIDDMVQVFDSTGSEFLATISKIDRQKAVLTVTGHQSPRICHMKTAIACAIPKRSIMDDIVDKLTQLGVDLIIPLLTERGIVKLEGKADRRHERWEKIAINASRQSQRNAVPVIDRIMDLKGAIFRSIGFDNKLIATTAGERQPLKAVVNSRSTSVFVLIGPEGDFTAKEIGQAADNGFVPVTLGDSVLRVETAAIAIASYLRLH